MKFDFMSSSIPEMVTQNIHEEFGYSWWPDRTPDIFATLLTSMAKFLKHNFSKKYDSVGFALRDAEGEFILGAALFYRAPEGDEDDKGNYNIEFYTTEEDFSNEEIGNIITDYESEFTVVCERFTRDRVNGAWVNNRVMFNTFKVCVETLKEFIFKALDNGGGEEVEVTLPGTFTAIGGVENDNKFWTITAGGAVKQEVKSDVLL